MKRNNSLIVWGTILLFAGAFLILGQTGVITHYDQYYIPAILLGLSIAFHLQYFLSSGRNEGILVPAGILLVYGLLFLAVQLWPQATMEKLWPLFILGPAVGLFEMYAFSGSRSGSMIPVFILTAVGGCALLLTFGVFSDWRIIVAILLIGVGTACMVNAFLVPRKGNSARQAAGSGPETKTEPKTEEAPKQS
jgi:hypothetical protein